MQSSESWQRRQSARAVATGWRKVALSSTRGGHKSTPESSFMDGLKAFLEASLGTLADDNFIENQFENEANLNLSFEKSNFKNRVAHSHEILELV